MASKWNKGLSNLFRQPAEIETMAAVITCPECNKKFKGKEELQGKKIRCPFCKEPFVVEEELEEAEEVTVPPGAAKAKAAARKPAEKAPPAPPAKPAPASAAAKGGDDDEEGGSNPYGITHLDIAPRCPNCANEMESEQAVICLYCGYNTLTRKWGNTKKVWQLTFRDYLLHLLPGLLAATGVMLMIAGVIYYCLVLPNTPKWEWLDMLTDHESTRLWIASIALFICWGLGFFAVNRLVMNPKPPDKVKGVGRG
jgi:DNA-directed RNA polymerase subunit RPC12/RpoP